MKSDAVLLPSARIQTGLDTASGRLVRTLGAARPHRTPTSARARARLSPDRRKAAEIYRHAWGWSRVVHKVWDFVIQCKSCQESIYTPWPTREKEFQHFVLGEPDP